MCGRVPALVTGIAGIVLNVFADYALMFGHFGLPALGLVGAGVASALVNTAMFACLMVFVLMDRRLRRYRLAGRFWRTDWPQLWELLRVGTPIAGRRTGPRSVCFWWPPCWWDCSARRPWRPMRWPGQCAAIVFMVALGISQAATVRVGRAVGAGDSGGCGPFGLDGVDDGACVFGRAGGGVQRFRRRNCRPVSGFLGGGEPRAIELAASLLVVAAMLHVADAAQVAGLGALRGLKDTKVPMLIALGGYLGIGLPGAAALGVGVGFGVLGIWAGRCGRPSPPSRCCWRGVFRAQSQALLRMAEHPPAGQVGAT